MPLASRLPQRHAGFSLIAMSILITVAAMVFVSVLPGQEAGDSNQKTVNNEKKLERVEEAMRSFMTVNGRRPCPADGQYAENTANFGLEAATPGTCTGGTPSAPLAQSAGNVVGGVIPTRSLGLPDEYQYDEFGRRFTYVVDKRATASWATAIGQSTTNVCAVLEGLTSTNSTPTATGGIQIETTATSGTVIDNVMAAYISHGASGYGAFPGQGSATRINSGSTDTDMQNNSNTTYGASSFTNSFVQKGKVASTTGDTGFDELVWYRQDLKNTCCLGAACVQKGFIVQGNATFISVGESIAVGDVNGDGIPDLVLGLGSGSSPNHNTVAVIFGTKTGFPDPLPISSLNGTNGFMMTAGAVWNVNTPVAVGRAGASKFGVS